MVSIDKGKFQKCFPIIYLIVMMQQGQLSNQPLYKKIDNYIFKFEDMLGQGNFSKVYKGVNEVTNETVAIKVIELNSLKSKKLEQLLFSEIDVLKKLSHPNVLKCYEVFTSNRNCYIITEICNGGDLETKLRKCHYFTENQAEPYILDVFKGLKYLAQNNVIHRDLKVANIFLHNGVAKIADFGFAKFTNQNFKDINIGSPIYMSPEGFIDNIYGPKTDVWAFGIFVFEMLHGKTPFSHCQNQSDLRREIRSPISYSSLKQDLSFEIKDVITKCLQINEERRVTVSELEGSPFFQRLMKVELVPLAKKYNNFLNGPQEVKAVNPNQPNLIRYRGTESMSRSLEKNDQRIYQNYGNIDTIKQNSEQRVFNSPNNRMLIVNNLVQPQTQNKSMYLSPYRQNLGEGTISSPSNQFSSNTQQNFYKAQLSHTPKTPPNPSPIPGMKQTPTSLLVAKQTPEQTPKPSLSPSHGSQNKARVESTYLNRRVSLENAMLPGMLSFKEAVNCLHYCRLLYKYIVMSREVDDVDRKFGSLLAALMFKILNEVSGKIERKQITYDNENTKKEQKLKEVSSEYYRKYSSDIERPFNCEASYDVVLSSVRSKIQEYQTQYLQKTGGNIYIQLLHFLVVVLQATQILRRCSSDLNFWDWCQYRYIEQFLSRSKNSMTYQSYMDMKIDIIKY